MNYVKRSVSANLRPVARALLAALLLALVVACGAAPAGPTAATEPAGSTAVPMTTEPTVAPTPAAPQLRVKNNGPADIEDLVILFPQDRVEFGDVPAGTTSEYETVPNGIYRYAAYELVVDGETVQQMVIDWVGEEPVAGQAFTYVLDVDPARSPFEVVQLVEATVDR